MKIKHYYSRKSEIRSTIQIQNELKAKSYASQIQSSIKEFGDYSNKSIKLPKNIKLHLFNSFFVIETKFITKGYYTNDIIKYDDISNINVVEDNKKSLKDTALGSLVGGGLGAIAQNIGNSGKFYLQITLKDGFVENFYCGSIATLEEFRTILDNKCNNSNKVDDSNQNIELRLEKLKSLYDKKLISEEEFYKRKEEILKEI